MKLPLSLAVPAALLALTSAYWVLGPGRSDPTDSADGGKSAATTAAANGNDNLDQVIASPVGLDSQGRQSLGELDPSLSRANEQRPMPPGPMSQAGPGSPSEFHPRDSHAARLKRQEDRRRPDVPLPPGIGSYEIQVFGQESDQALRAFNCIVHLKEGDRPPVKFRLNSNDGVADFPVPRDQVFDLHVEAQGYETAVLKQLGFEFKSDEPLQVVLVRSN